MNYTDILMNESQVYKAALNKAEIELHEARAEVVRLKTELEDRCLVTAELRADLAEYKQYAIEIELRLKRLHEKTCEQIENYRAEIFRLKKELEDARIYADGLSAGLEKAQVDNRTMLEKLEKTEMELRSLRMKGE